MSFLWGTKKKEPKGEPVSDEEREELVRALQRDVKDLEDTIYGVAVFFEGLSLLHAGQSAVLETYQKQFRNIIQTDSDTLKQAEALLSTVERDPGQAFLLKQFALVPCKGHSSPQELARRARVLVDTYNRLFPGRSRSREFTEDEMFRLVEEAVGAFAALG